MTTRLVALQRILPATMMFGGFVAVWQLAVTGLGVREYLLPSPLSVLQAMGPGEIPWTKHIWITAVEILGAFLIAALAGVLLGAAIAWSQAVSRALTPFLVFVNTLPEVAIAPLFLIWLGYGAAAIKAKMAETMPPAQKPMGCWPRRPKGYGNLVLPPTKLPETKEQILAGTLTVGEPHKKGRAYRILNAKGEDVTSIRTELLHEWGVLAKPSHPSNGNAMH
jgi:hypothetical protein